MKRVQITATRENLWKNGDKILIAASGGPDSTFLVHFLAMRCKKENLTLALAHVNYGLRGKESDSDEAFVRNLAHHYKIPIYVKKIKKNLKSVSNNEERLRIVRYVFLEKIALTKKYHKIAVAHNKDDLVETFLMNLFRGAGMQGLRSIQYINNKIVRPLLEQEKKEIIKYLKKNKLPYCQDRTNNDTTITRNLWRKKIIPYLQKKINPQLKNTIYNTARILTDDNEILEEITAQKCLYKKRGQMLSFSAKHIICQSTGFQYRFIQTMIKDLTKSFYNRKKGEINEILKILKSVKNKDHEKKLNDLIIKRKNDTVTIVFYKKNSKK